MRDKTRPTSRVIQISTTNVQEVADAHPDYFVTTALCEDGSIWERTVAWGAAHRSYDWCVRNDEWYCILKGIQPTGKTHSGFKK